MDTIPSYEQVFDSFDAMELKTDLLKGIYAYGLEKPSPIQQKGIVPFCNGLDVLIQQIQQPRSTKTDKTVTFCCGVLQRLNITLVQCQALVLTPSREHAQEIGKIMKALGEYLGVKLHAYNGSKNLYLGRTILEFGVHVVVGTPGSVFDMFRREYIRADAIEMFVLDEVDDMLSLGFRDCIYDIFRRLPPSVQTGVFSTTVSPEPIEIARRFSNRPVKILLEREVSLEGIKQFYVNVEKEEWKLEVLCDIHEALSTVPKSVVFVNTSRKVSWLTGKLKSLDHLVLAMPGDMDHTRDVVLHDFRSGSARILIANELFMGGIDAEQVKVVINYDIPTTPEDYIHRMGTSVRCGRKGIAINFVTKDDESMFSDIERFYNMAIEELQSDFADLI